MITLGDTQYTLDKLKSICPMLSWYFEFTITKEDQIIYNYDHIDPVQIDNLNKFYKLELFIPTDDDKLFADYIMNEEYSAFCDNMSLNDSILNGYSTLIKYLYLNKQYEFTDDTFQYAAENGNLDNMKWLKDQGCCWGINTFSYASKNGNLDNMKWLKSQGCPWDLYTFTKAAKNGNLDNMKWLKEQGCPLYKDAYYYSVQNGHLSTMQWLEKHI